MPLKYSLITQILKEYNFLQTRSNGSHFRYEKNGYGLTVAFHKEYPPKTAKSMLQDIARIEWISYQELKIQYNIKI